MAVKVLRVSQPSDLKKFLNFPYRLHKNDPHWVAPLRREQRQQLDRKTNAKLRHCDYQLFLAMDNNRVVGRLSAFVDRHAVKHWGKRIGLFGNYECIEDATVADKLLRSAAGYLVGQRCVSMRGPWSFASQEWGLLVEGFEKAPVIMAPHNPEYYVQHLEAFGLAKATDLMVYEANLRTGYEFPQRVESITDAAERRHGIKIRNIDLGNIAEEIELIVGISNRALSANWGFAPVTANETRALAKDMRGLLKPSMVQIAETEAGEGIGYALVMPDLNVLLKRGNGSLFPSLWWKLATQVDRIRSFRMWALAVVPEYQGKSIDSLLYRRAYEALKPLKPRIEVNYVLEDNKRTCNALERMGLEQIRRYRVYEKTL